MGDLFLKSKNADDLEILKLCIEISKVVLKSIKIKN